ncbi:PH-like domain-containing protein [Gandjariella thermophila]|uniref:Transporter n=1 Tax=Gandjariella thermophila TaxID=1931992 RepID=A0A4D4IXE1_9PSEU|nr:transporter [Gandjariella thermophila]GDY28871.1 transporter [Gandjariella thermophila]
MIRFLLVLVVVAFFVLCAAAMWWGWRNRARRQAAVLPPFPEAPAWWRDGKPDRTPLLPVATGVYVGTTTAGDWQDRIAVSDVGFRAAAELALFDAGLVVSRSGASPLWIPVEALREARTDRALAGKVMTADGLLVVRWRLGDHLLDTGFRGDDKDLYPRWVAELNRLAERHAPAERTQGGAEQ